MSHRHLKFKAQWSIHNISSCFEWHARKRSTLKEAALCGLLFQLCVKVTLTGNDEKGLWQQVHARKHHHTWFLGHHVDLWASTLQRRSFRCLRIQAACRWVDPLQQAGVRSLRLARTASLLSISTSLCFSFHFIHLFIFSTFLLSLSLSHSICIHFLVRSESWETTLCFFTLRSPERLAE